ncbi:unnamed protein product [Angiostrongylus costaricensis]|uniref:Aminotran_1_2 domain-containing protein n=1 Tax=Angiostrongylus costaricensis TaxID=334426 RepID=A0A158PI77_ANGCS|nr:unnamed protein product [Angiostrongylus costaricensis]
MTRNISDDGEPPTFVEIRQRRRTSSADGRLVAISGKFPRLRSQSTETGRVKGMESMVGKAPAHDGHKYIITSLSQSHETVRTPSVRRFCAEVNASSTTKPEMSDEPRKAASVVLSCPGEQVPCTSTPNRNILVEREHGDEVEIAHEERPLLEETRNFPTSSQNVNENHRHPVELISDGREIRHSHSVPTNPDYEKSKPADCPASVDDETSHSSIVGSSPIVVINQHRKGIPILLDGGKNRKRCTITDIDWFAAFNMKEPPRSKSPHNQTVDVLKEAEIVGGRSHSTLVPSKREAERKEMNESKINIDDVFCENSEVQAVRKKCPCSACNLLQLNDDERKQLGRQSSRPPKCILHTDLPEPPSSNITPAVEISLDEIFCVANSSTTQGEIVGNGKEKGRSIKNIYDRSANSCVIGSAAPLREPETDVRKSSSSPEYPNSGSRQTTWNENVQTRSSDFKLTAEEIESNEYDRAHRAPLEPVPSIAEHRLSNPELYNGAPQSLNWVEKLVVSGDGGSSVNSNTYEILKTTSTTFAPRRPARGKEVNEELTHMEVKTANGSVPSLRLGDRATVPKTREWQKAGEIRQINHEQIFIGSANNVKNIRKSGYDPHTTTPVGTKRKGEKVEPVMAGEHPTKLRADLNAAELHGHAEYEPTDKDRSPSNFQRDPESSISTLDPEEIHFPHGRKTLVGDILRKPSVLEETSFNTDHLSPKEDVTRAYCQRLSQLKSELGLDKMDSEETKAPTSLQCSKSVDAVRPVYFYGEQETSDGAMSGAEQKTFDHDAMIDVAFSEVLDGEKSDQISLGDSSLSQTLQEPEVRDECSRTKRSRNLTQEPELDDGSRRPTVHVLEGTGVKEYVTKLLEHSLDDAVSSASTSLKKKLESKDDCYLLTDTSFDRKHRKQWPLSDEEQEEGNEHEEDPILREIFTSNINNQQLMESVISYPLSVAPSDLTPPAVVTSGLNKLKEESDGSFHSHSHAHRNTSGDVTYVSNASMVMNDTHSSSDAEFDEDHIMKLVFSQPIEICKLEPRNPTNSSQSREPVSAAEEASQTPDSSVHCQISFREKDEKEMGIHSEIFHFCSDLLSSRARNLLTDEDVADMVYSAMNSNRFNEEINPQGNINFCTAENNLCADEVMSRLRRHGFSPTEASLVHYPPAGGHLTTKRVMLEYLSEFMSAKVEENELVILPSTISAYDMLCHCMCEEDDIVLTGAATYAASVRNVGARAHCRIRTVEGEIVRAVLIINPHNPLGAVFPPEEVIQLCNWATRNNLAVLIDESFSSCVFGLSSFKSFLSYRHQLEQPKYVAYMWSLSKDFGIPGLKISVVQTSSSELMMSLSRLELIHPVSALAHDAATVLLSDHDWLRRFHALKLAKMSAHYEFVAKHLREIGLNFIPTVAGCFIMVDFRKAILSMLNLDLQHLRSQTFASELSLFHSLCDRGVMLTPGQHVLAHEPGWMRLVFTCNKSELVEGAPIKIFA